MVSRSWRKNQSGPCSAATEPAAEAILLFGPGEAKGEIKKRIERNKLDLRITRFETMDKMTERQISQKGRGHYLPSGVTRPPGGSSKR